MAYVKIPKDLQKVKRRPIGGLTIRQLIGVVISVVMIGLSLYYLYKPLGITGAAMVGLLLAVPVMFIAVSEKNGQIIFYRMRKRHQPAVRLYRSEQRYSKCTGKGEQCLEDLEENK